MAILIGSARTDENGEDHSGKAGDQTGHEVETQPWYLHDLGWVVIRPKDKDVGNYIAEDVQYACDNPNVGYDQWNANSLYNVARPYGFDISKVTTPCETHCAALIRVGVCYAGVKLDINVLINCPEFYTGNEVSVLKATGQFDILDDPKYTKNWEWLRRGDILVTPVQGHTVCVLEDGPYAYEETPTGSLIYKTTGNVYIRKGPGIDYAKVGAIPKGKYVYVYEIVEGWARCSYEDKEGYVSMKYLTEVDKRYFTTGNVWMRKSAGVLGIPIMTIKAGSFVKGTGMTASVLGSPWYEVIYDGKIGWCSGKYLQKCS